MLTPRYRSHPNRQSYQAPPSAHAPNSYRNSSYGRPISSIYSQPSPDAATFAAQQLRVEVALNDPGEISPPSSPDALSPRDEPNPGDVSPIEEVPDMSQLGLDPRGPFKGESRSNIPMMRRERRKNSEAAISALRESKSRERLKQQRPFGHDIRWDPSTGEPTTDAKGRPSQVKPQEYAHGLGIQPGSPSPPPIKQAQQGHASFGDRIRRVRQPSGSPQPEPAPRPEWRGASGRAPIVAPVSDKMDVAPLKLPRKSSKRASREPSTLSPVNSVGSDSATTPLGRGPGVDSGSYNRRISTHPGPQPQSPSIAVSNASISPQTYPSPPLSDDNTIPTTYSPAQREPPIHLKQSLQIPSNDKAIRRKPAGGTGHYPQQSTSSSIYSQQEVHPAQRTPDTSQDGWTQPPSRFSITTYATSHQSSTPRESFDVNENAPPIPTPPQQFASQQQQSSETAPGNSILDRKRPIVAGYDGVSSSRKNSPIEPVKISLDSPYYMTSAVPSSKPPRQSSPSAAAAGGPNDSRLSLASALTAADKDKSLPPAPPETQSQTQDRVAQLNAKLQALGNRRINLHTAIKQMTELMPTDYILASEAVVRKREAEKRKVEALRGELADVERESYELGLKLHRAYKRMDRDLEYEPTTLWVRRVTGS
ncbi:hypothetical protein F4820DRAFT_409842 [Hypoxylon rubiginosum]|uniref:Uncharacterized protein n=1 Tax=Hypoxylon rubiginosum TaxID=110542 RepID=A0ACB9ZBN6_9PEZI|nr:hypothetical protein F4820DRAFT_409842 [Hypoxylon rubiginosum]